MTSAAANSEILFSLMVNPNVLGAGMPGGSYAGNQGGSNIREAFLVNIANSYIDRQNILDPLQLYMQFNGAPDDLQLRFRNTIQPSTLVLALRTSCHNSFYNYAILTV